MSAEYAFNRAAFDDELQTIDLRTILDYSRGRLSFVANPSLELVTRGSDDGLEPVFDLSVRGVWQLANRVALTTDYFSAVATTRHLQPEPSALHLIFGGRTSTLVPDGNWASARGTVSQAVSRG